jgi:formylglycine-generating enzyme
MSRSCCTPSREPSQPSELATQGNTLFGGRHPEGMVRIPGGTFRMGNPRRDGYPADGEGPVHEVTVDPFWMDETAVTNARFAVFVEATGYRTEAETFGWSFVFRMFLPEVLQRNPSPVGTPWWRQVFGADWRHPEGPQSDIAGRMDHPAIHISWNDAQAYCAWAGVRLPTEAEWEIAARGGIEGAAFPWGNELEPGGAHRMNVWQGQFPAQNSQADGYIGTAPAGSYEPNGFGLFCMTGNVWEWCADWFSPTTYRRGPVTNPTGPESGGARVMRGGSYLCHASYCNRYRVDSRSSNTPDSSTGNLGFRTVWSDHANPRK